MISRSTDVRAALRSRQRGFLLNPFRFGASGGGTDPLYGIVSALLHMDGANGSTTFTDHKGGSFTGFGNAQISTAQWKWGGASALFDGSGDYVSGSYSTSLFDWWTTDFTVECWIYLNGYPAVSNIFGNMEPFTPTNYWNFGVNNLGQVEFYYYNGATNYVIGSTTLPLSTWSHAFMTYEAATSTIRVGGGGTVHGSAARSGTPLSSNGSPLQIGQVNGISLNAYVDDLRVTKGAGGARYTGAYTVPTGPFPNS